MLFRMKRVNQLIKKELGEILLHELQDPKIGFCTVTTVEVSKDLRTAYVGVSVMGDDRQKQTAIKHLQKAAGYIHKLLCPRVVLRYVPKLKFKLDHSIDHAFHIADLIDQIHADEGLRNNDDQQQQEPENDET